MDPAALLFAVNEPLRRIAAGQGTAADAEQLAAAMRELEAAVRDAGGNRPVAGGFGA